MNPNQVPVIVASSRITQKVNDLNDALGPIELALKTINGLNDDLNFSEKDFKDFLSSSSAIGTVQMFYSHRYRAKFKQNPYSNFSLSLANRLNVQLPKDNIIESVTGGNGPQLLVNYFAERIHSGEEFNGPILIGGVEVCSSFDKVFKSKENKKFEKIIENWKDTTADSSYKTIINDETMKKVHDLSVSEIMNLGHAIVHGGFKPIVAYALIENALLHQEVKESQSMRINEEIFKDRVQLMKELNDIASRSEYSWFKQNYSKKELLDSDRKKNRMLSVPYSKLLVARDEVDMASFVCIMSLAEAMKRKIPKEKLVFFQGGCSGYDPSIVALHDDIFNSKALRYAYEETIKAAKVDINDISYFDIYTCFPSALQVGIRTLKELKREHISAEILSTTGGLPYHGGPGSNYSTHGLCALISNLRSNPGKYGMICANGGILSEHSCGIYSTSPPEQLVFPKSIVFPTNSEIKVDPAGLARILSWTVEYKKNKKTGIIIGEVLNSNHRFFANSTCDSVVDWLLERNRVGELVKVSKEKVLNFKSLDVPLVTFVLSSNI